jgi:hypothetical protein
MLLKGFEHSLLNGQNVIAQTKSSNLWQERRIEWLTAIKAQTERGIVS